eukprot:TRINITY_DN1002_c0_g1_i4.p1 TRINITY_DN1002_c0_g1~~TRINITY_DN1002_c0_g1_i4.p1  ORF type:complete len:307 (-),score=107.85 TRINITY_DN1002_c0_g1_i4:95-958(-)
MSSDVVASFLPDGASEVQYTKDKADFRNYADSKLQDRVSRTYEVQHTQMTYTYAQEKLKHFTTHGINMEMTIWEACEMLNAIVDESDPDVDTPQIHHLLQTAEAIRRAYPGEEWDWFHLTGLIHDLGKLLALPQVGLPQWAVVGDTFPVGCKFVEENVFSEFFAANPDNSDPRYNTVNGVYEPGCGLDKVTMSWGHDEYMYQVCLRNKATLPVQALYMIRFHSFYPWHRYGAYTHLLNDQDRDMLKWVLEFNKYDLYSKEDVAVDVATLKEYYTKLAHKYFPEKVKF